MDLIINKDLTRVSGTEPSSMTLSQTKGCLDIKAGLPMHIYFKSRDLLKRSFRKTVPLYCVVRFQLKTA